MRVVSESRWADAIACDYYASYRLGRCAVLVMKWYSIRGCLGWRLLVCFLIRRRILCWWRWRSSGVDVTQALGASDGTLVGNLLLLLLTVYTMVRESLRGHAFAILMSVVSWIGVASLRRLGHATVGAGWFLTLNEICLSSLL